MVLLPIAAIAGAWWWSARDGSVPLVAASVASAASSVATPPPAAVSASARPARARAGVARDDDPRCVAKSRPLVLADDGTADPLAVSEQQATRAEAARARLLAGLQASADAYANAVAVWLDVRHDDDASAAERVRRLAALAASTSDPRLYALALRSCWGHAKSACEGLSARRWAELDPDNAMPWLMMLDEAGRDSDLSGAQEAMFHISRAPRLAERNWAPLQPIVDAASDDPESLAAARALAIEATGISAAQVGPIGYTVCKHATPANANVWQQCVAMADLLTHRSDSLQARLIGASMAQRLTGDLRPREKAEAQMKRMLSATLELDGSTGCRDLRGKLALMRRVAVEGEVAPFGDPSP